jgi:hypothetical protein
MALTVAIGSRARRPGLGCVHRGIIIVLYYPGIPNCFGSTTAVHAGYARLEGRSLHLGPA